VDGVLKANKQLDELLASNGLSLTSFWNDQRNSMVNAARAYRGVDRTITSANKSSVSAWLNNKYIDSNSILRTNENYRNIAA
jgi:hypothetical protein